MADTLAPTKTTKTRKENADYNNYASADKCHNRPINKRTWRKFKYSWRRVLKQSKFYAAPAVAGRSIYCNYLGPSGIVLLAVKESTKPVLTWLRYPVSFRRRSRYLETFATYSGETVTVNNQEKFTGKGMLVYSGTYAQVAKYIELLNSGEANCVAVAKNAESADQDIAKICCNANGWDFT